MDPKLLTESGWKATASKFKIKDNGLQRALAAYEKLDDDEHDDRIAGSPGEQLADALKRAKSPPLPTCRIWTTRQRAKSERRESPGQGCCRQSPGHDPKEGCGWGEV